MNNQIMKLDQLGDAKTANNIGMAQVIDDTYGKLKENLLQTIDRAKSRILAAQTAYLTAREHPEVHAEPDGWLSNAFENMKRIRACEEELDDLEKAMALFKL